jgi:hypothetical protein
MLTKLFGAYLSIIGIVVLSVLLTLALTGCGKESETLKVTETVRQVVERGSLESFLQQYMDGRPSSMPPPVKLLSYGYKDLSQGACGGVIAVGCCTGRKELWIDQQYAGQGDILKVIVWHEAAHCVDNIEHNNHPTMREVFTEDAYIHGVRHPLDERS